MKLLSNASIGIKVAIAPVFAIVCLVIVAAIGLAGSISGSRALSDIHDSRIPSLIVAGDVEKRMSTLNAKVNQSLVWEGAGAKAPAIQALDARIAADFASLAGLIEKQQASTVWSESDLETWASVASEFGKYRKSVGDTLDMKSAGLGAAAGFITINEVSYDKLHDLISRLVSQQQALTNAGVQTAEDLSHKSRVITMTTVLIAVVAAGLATWLCRRLIVEPLVRAAGIASAVAHGHLATPDVDMSTDETGRLLAALLEVTQSLGVIVKGINVAASDIDAVSDEIALGNKALATRTEQAGSALAETAASIERINVSVRMSAGNAQEADSLAREASGHARDGGAIVDQAVASIEAISAQSRRIGEIVGVIDGIAFQTNILALNAAVEAARAGEQGRGFAVVAGEVRTLAQRSAVAAKEIRRLIFDSVAQIGDGAEKVRSAGGAMGKIMASVEQVSTIVREISSGTAEQAAGIEQIRMAINEIDRTTQHNSAMVQAAGQSADSLKTQSRQLMTAISAFHIDGRTSATQPVCTH